MVRLLNSFTLLCKEYNPHNKFVWDTNTCVCDFRINIHGCPEQDIYRIANWILIPYCLLLSIVSSICLYHLIYVKKQPFFLPARKDRGILRPRPQHICYALALIYCPWKIIHILQLLNDFYPTVAWAEIFQILPRILIASFSVFYPLSILYSTGAIEIDSTLSLIESNKSNKSSLMVDITCIFMMLLPIIIFLPLAGLTGYYADIGDIEKANNYFITQNILWILWGIFYLSSLIYFWSTFIPRILKNIDDLVSKNGNDYYKNNPELKSKFDQFLKNRDKITVPTIWKIIPPCLYLLILLLYTVFHRSNTIFIYGINITLSIIWQYGIPITIHIIQWIVIYNTYVASKNKHNNKKMRNNNRNRSTITGISLGGGNDEKSDVSDISNMSDVPLTYHSERYSYSSTKNLNLNNDSLPKYTHNRKKDSYNSSYSVDIIKSKKSEWTKNNSISNPQRHSINIISDINHGFSSGSANNIKSVKKIHRPSSSSIVNRQ